MGSQAWGESGSDLQIALESFDLCEGPQWKWRKRLKAKLSVQSEF